MLAPRRAYGIEMDQAPPDRAASVYPRAVDMLSGATVTVRRCPVASA